MAKVFLLRFRTPYILRSRNPLEIVDSFTVLRALIDIASKVGFTSLFSNVASGLLASSSILPAVRNGNSCYRLLAPMSAIPTVPDKIFKTIFVPLHVVREAVLKPYSRLGEYCLPLHISYTEKQEVKIRCGNHETIYPQNIFYSYDDLFRRIEEVKNAVDRITPATDLYKVRSIMSLTESWIAFSGSVNESTLRSALQILGEMGIGAARNRGKGKFELIEAVPCREDIEALTDLEALSQRFSPGPVMLLGSYLPNPRDSYNPSLCIITPNHIYGLAGDAYNEYGMPMFISAGTGSILWFVKPAKPNIYELQVSEDFKPKMIFNPVVLGHAS